MYPGRRRQRMRVGLCAHKSEALNGGGSSVRAPLPLPRNGLTPLLCGGASFCTSIFSRTLSGVTSSRTPAGRTSPQQRGSAAGLENMPCSSPPLQHLHLPLIPYSSAAATSGTCTLHAHPQFKSPNSHSNRSELSPFRLIR